MSKFNVAEQYSGSQIKTAGKLKSIQMLHEGAIRFLKQSLAEKEELELLTVKAQNIIAQLEMTLRFSNTETSELLFYLYDYIYLEIEKKTPESITNAIELLNHLLETVIMLELKPVND